MKICTAILGIAVLICSGYTIAQPRELLIDVRGTDMAEVRAKNQYFMSKRTYSARHHKIVKVDVDALLSNEPISIKLFGNESFMLNPLGVETRGEGALILWTGVVEHPGKSVDELISSTGSAERAQALFETYYTVRIGASKYQHDREFAANFPYYPEAVQPAGARTQNFAVDESDLFYGVSATIKLPELGAIYALSPLEMGAGGYHIFYELDPSKFTSPGPEDDPGNPEEGAKRKALREFSESLGEDPRLEILRIKQAREQAKEEMQR